MPRTSFRDSHFYIWKQRIDNFIFDELYLHLDDLPDEPYRIWFEETDLTPKEAAEIIIQHNDFF